VSPLTVWAIVEGRRLIRMAPTPRNNSQVRGAVDALVQGALVELFHAYGVALAPLPRTLLRDAPTFNDVSASIGFTRRVGAGRANASGRVTLSIPGELFTLAKDDEIRSARPEDWARELVNQLIGRIKNRLLPFGVTLHIGLPTSGLLHHEEPKEHSSTVRIYRARTMKGDVVLTLDGVPDESELCYVGTEGAASEGELLLF
jgi:hypothetical protein